MQKNKKAVRLFLWIGLLESLCFYAPVAGLYRMQFGLSLAQITLIEAVLLVLCLVLEVPWGLLTVRIGYKKTLLWAGLLNCAAGFLFWRASGFWGFLAQRCVLAMAVSGFSGCDIAYLCRLVSGKQQARALGAYSAAGYGGLILAGLCFSAVQPLGYRWLALLTLVATAMGTLLRFWLPALPAEPQDLLGLKSQLVALKSLFVQNPAFLGLIACGAAMFETEHTVTVFFTSPAWAAAGISPRWFGLLNLALNMAGLAGGLAAARLMKRLGINRTLVLCWGGVVFAAGALALVPGGLALVCCMPLLRFAAESYRPCEQLLKNCRTGAAGRAVALSAYNMVASCVGAAVGPLLGGCAGKSPEKGFLAAAVLLCFFAAGAALFYRQIKKGNRYVTESY